MIIIVILAVFLEMILPQGKMTSYLRMVMGLLIIVAVLQAASGLLQQNWLHDVPVVTYSAEVGPPIEEIIASGKQLELQHQDQAIEKYKEGISRQVSALAQLNSQLVVVDVNVELHDDPAKRDFGVIKQIELIIDPVVEGDNNDYLIEPVQVKIGDNPTEQLITDLEVPVDIKKATREMAASIAGLYNLSSSDVIIKYGRS